jgi:hypothetical protein
MKNYNSCNNKQIGVHSKLFHLLKLVYIGNMEFFVRKNSYHSELVYSLIYFYSVSNDVTFHFASFEIN